MQSSETGHPVHQKIVRLMEQLKPLGVTNVHIRFCGIEAHFVPDEPITSINFNEERHSSQQYFPVSPISSSVIILAKEIHHPW